MASRWPKDNQAALIAFYGDPGSRTFGANLVKVVPPFRMTYAGKPVAHLSFHRLAAPALLRALNNIWNYYGRSQAKIDALRISEFSGTYNPRKVRGSATKWSNHAYGAAIDLDAPHNGFGAGKGTIPKPVIAAFKAEGFSWGGDYKNRTDPMHFELCDRGEPARTFEQWLSHYGCAPPSVPMPKPRPVEAPSLSAAPANLTPAQADAVDSETLDSADEPEEQEGAVLQEAPAKSMATSKIGVTQVITGTATGIGGAGAVAKAVLENTTETVNGVSQITDQVGTVVVTTETVVTAVPSGFVYSVLNVVTSPVFISCVVVVVLAGCALTWYWRRQYRQAGI